MSIVDEIKSKIDIVDLISEYVHLEKKGNGYRGLCPFHNEKTPSFFVSPDKQLYYCFGCQKGGDIIKFLCDYDNIDFAQSLEELSKKAGIDIKNKNPYQNKIYILRQKLFEIYRQAAIFYVHSLYKNVEAIKYLKKRGIDKDMIVKFGIGYSPSDSQKLYKYLLNMGYEDKYLSKSGIFKLNKYGKMYDIFFNRIIFPILNKQSKVIAFGGRVLIDATPKYLNSPETDIFIKKDQLYGLHLAIKSRKKFFIACEGYMDVIALNKAGYDNAVASLGTALTIQQLHLIKAYTNNLYLMYDSDNAGINAIKRAIPLALQEGLHLKIVSLAPYKDPDELIKVTSIDEMTKRIEDAQDPIFFQADILFQNMDVSNPDSILDFHQNLSDILSDITEVISRNSYILSCAKRYNIDSSLLKSTVDKIGYNKEVNAYNAKVRTKNKNLNHEQIKFSKAQYLLLSWICEDVKIFEKIKDIIEKEDFTFELFGKIYEKIQKALNDGDSIPYNDFMNNLNEDEMNIVAKILSKGTNFQKDIDYKRTLNELIIKIKMESYNYCIEQIKTLDKDLVIEMNNKLIEKKKYIEKLKMEGQYGK